MTPRPVEPLTVRLVGGMRFLHGRFMEDLGDAVLAHGSLSRRPLELDLAPPLPARVRLYLFKVGSPPGARTPGEAKIEIRLPGQAKHERRSFDYSGGRVVLLAGYEPDYEVYVFWDADMYRDFSHSRNIQVRPETLVRAYVGHLAEQERRLRMGGYTARETVVVAPRDRLLEAILRRRQLTRERL